jgi:hypothetical protein
MREYLYSASRVWTAPECPLFEWTSFFGGEQMARIIFTILKYLYSPFIILVIALLVGLRSLWLPTPAHGLSERIEAIA